MNGPSRGVLARWELVGEQLKHESNLKMNLLKCLYDWTPFWEKYLSGAFEIHAHAQFGKRAICLQLTAHRVLGEGEHARHGEVYAYRKDLPVFGGVIEVPKKARPLASFERLKLANDCHVFFADAYEKARAPSREALGRILYQELCAALRGASIIGGQHIDQVVQRRSEISGDLSDQHARVELQRVEDVLVRTQPFLKIFLCKNTVFAQLADLADKDVEIRQVFVCPRVSAESALKLVHGAYDD